MLFGVLNVNKPAQLTSRDVVNRIVRQCPRKTKVGHAGTLDPMATGVLVVAIGPATKLIQYAQGSSKTYVGSFRLGLRSDTEDITGTVEELPDAPQIARSDLVAAFDQFTGQVMQTPPQYSAVKVDGQRAYKAARQGKPLDIKPRPTRIDSLQLVSFEFPDVQIEIKCGKGTYVRTLGRDIAKSLGSDSVMTALTRTAVGEFSIESSNSLQQIQANPIEEMISSPSSIVSDMPKVVLNSEETQRLLHGKRLRSSNWEVINEAGQELAAFDRSGQLLGILEWKSATEYASKINFVPQLYSWRSKNSESQ